MIVVVSSIIHTVNNGKAWSMTVLYTYSGANNFSTDTQLALRCGSPHDTIPRIEEQQDDCGCFTIFILLTMGKHGAAWSMTVLYVYIQYGVRVF